MLKPQDVVLLIKLLSQRKKGNKWPQNKLAMHLCISASEVNAIIKRLCKSELLRRTTDLPAMITEQSIQPYLPIIKYSEEFLIYGVKYVFPVQLGKYTRGIATSYAAPVFENKIMIGKDPIPVWPYAEGNVRGLTLSPLYPSVPKSLSEYPDKDFYDLLALVDAIRNGRARERDMAIKILKKRLSNDKE